MKRKQAHRHQNQIFKSSLISVLPFENSCSYAIIFLAFLIHQLRESGENGSAFNSSGLKTQSDDLTNISVKRNAEDGFLMLCKIQKTTNHDNLNV